MEPLIRDIYMHTITLVNADTLSKQERCSNYEADIWWSVFWFMQQEPKVKMQEADYYATKVSRWAHSECYCEGALE